MKTKTIFEPSDFKGCGQVVVRNSSPEDSTDLSFKASVSYKIGWMHAPNGENHYFMISLTDGMITRCGPSLENLCNYFNNDAVGFRPLTKQELMDVMQHLGNGF